MLTKLGLRGGPLAVRPPEAQDLPSLLHVHVDAAISMPLISSQLPSLDKPVEGIPAHAKLLGSFLNRLEFHDG